MTRSEGRGVLVNGKTGTKVQLQREEARTRTFRPIPSLDLRVSTVTFPRYLWQANIKCSVFAALPAAYSLYG